MSHINKRVPKRRFEEFNNVDAWEQRKLGDYAEILTGGTPKTSISEYWEPKRIPWMSSGEVNKRRLDGTDNMISEEGLNNSNARWVKEHSVLIALAGQGKTRGTVAVNNIKLTTNQSIAAIVPNDNLHHEFIYQNLIKRYDELRMISSGDGTRGGLNKRIVSDILLLSPSKEEQIKIGTFLKQLDDTFALHQRKLEKIKALKAAYLSEMFPAEGETKPKRRFAGFTDDWEQRKLGDHAKYRRGSFPQPYGNKEWYDGEGAMPFVQVVDVTSKLTLVENTKQKISKLAQPKSVFVPKGKVIVTLQGSIGRVAITQYDSFVDRTLLIFDDYEKETDERFWAYTIQKKFEIEKLKAPGGTIKTITKEALSSFDVHLPQFEEQQKIGVLFKQLDDTIALHQRKLQKLQNIKKAYLNEMFI
ncbi:restriction endonuclease subunit S [Listeria monocytogenes]|nr:restriction endonuclease subunit S [Listeria monocytogenes]